MQCPGCGREVPDGMKFCAGCGTRVEVPAMAACPQCGAVHAPAAKFCKACGHSFVAAATAAPAEEIAAPAAPSPTSAPADPPVVPVEPATAAQPPDLVAPVAPVPPPAAPPMPPVVRGQSRMPGWLIGVIAAVVIVLVGGAAAFAYFKFFKPAPQQEVAAVPAPESAPLASAPVGPTPVVSAMAGAPEPASAVSAPLAVAPAPEPVGSTNGGVDASSQAVAATPLQQPSVGPTAPAAAPAPENTPPPVDHSLKIAADLVSRGERAYSQGDYEEAVRHARSALDVRAGYAPAQKLRQRAYAAQKRVSEQQQREQQLAAEQQQAQAAAAAAAERPKPPTPDEVYNQRAHSECARGLFGKSCRHKIRVEVCTGVAAGAPGTSVCKEQD